MKTTDSTVKVDEEFVFVDTRSLDSKNRLTLAGSWHKVITSRMKVDSYQVLVGDDGDILLRPSAVVPSREAWIYHNPKAIKKIRKGLEEASKGKMEKVVDVDEFLDKL